MKIKRSLVTESLRFMSLLLKKCIEVLATVREKCISALIDKYNYSLTH